MKKRKRGRPRKNIKFRPLVSNKGMVFEEEAEEDVNHQSHYLGKRQNKPPLNNEGQADNYSQADNNQEESDSDHSSAN